MTVVDHRIRRVCPPASCALCGSDLPTLVIVERIIEDLLDCLERWHRLGYDDWKWVAEYWERRVAPSIGVDLPKHVLAATDAAGVHRALLAWQDDVVEHLV